MNALFRICCKNFHAPWIPESWTWNYLCISSLTYLGTVACAEGSIGVSEKVWWEGRSLGRAAWDLLKLGITVTGLPCSEKTSISSGDQQGKIFISPQHLSWRLNIQGRRGLRTAVFKSFPGWFWLSQTFSQQPTQSTPPRPSDKRNAWGVSVTLP